MQTDLFATLGRLYRHFSMRRRRQLRLLLLVMLLGSVAELVSLGMVLPFLALMSDPSRGSEFPVLQRLVQATGLEGSSLLPAVTVAFAVVALAAACVRVIVSWGTNKFSMGIGYDLGVAIYERILFQPYAFFVARNSSETIAVINNVQSITTRVVLPGMLVISCGVIAVAILGALLVVDALVATVAGLGFGAIYLLVSRLMRRRLRAYGKIVATAQPRRIQLLQEGVGSIRNVILDGTQGVYVEKFARSDGPLRDAEAASIFVAVAPRYVIEALSMVLIAGLAYGISLDEGGVARALPVLGALALGAQKMLPLLHQVYNSWVTIVATQSMLQETLAILDLPFAHGRARSEPMSFVRSVRLAQLSFRYTPSGPWILRDVNLTIPRGARVGIIGKTGGGKSTTSDILMGLLEPTEGGVYVDDVVVDASNRGAWQEHIAHVPQAIYLSDASIAQNIALGVNPRDIDMERVHEAARQAQVAEFIEKQEKGYDTLVGERGVRLSGGQRQRIAIARALYKNADVLVLDEATSALDDSTEQAVIECIEGLRRDLTVVIIAHRLTTVRSCDFIVRLDAGAVVARGSFDEVVVAGAALAGEA